MIATCPCVGACSMVLSTDMAQHFKHLADFRSVVEHMVEGRTVPPATGETTGGNTDEGFTDTKTRVLLCAVVHLADLGLSTKPWHLCRQWWVYDAFVLVSCEWYGMRGCAFCSHRFVVVSDLSSGV